MLADANKKGASLGPRDFAAMAEYEQRNKPRTPHFCRTCAFWDIDNARDRAGRIRKEWSARCLWRSTEVWPVSIAHPDNHRPVPRFMTADRGQDCPCWQLMDNPSRCAVCGWPLKEHPEAGCVRGNCSHRPLPLRAYAPERGRKEYGESWPFATPAQADGVRMTHHIHTHLTLDDAPTRMQCSSCQTVLVWCTKCRGYICTSCEGTTGKPLATVSSGGKQS